MDNQLRCKMIRTILVVLLIIVNTTPAKTEVLSNIDSSFAFIVTTDMREFAGPEFQTSQYFLGTCEAIRDIGKGSFMISPGDIDPPQHVYATVKNTLGEDYLWYPLVGNHEAETPSDMEWLRNWGKADIPNLVRRGPENCEETTFAFDYGNAHFVMLNEYFNGSSDYQGNADIVKPLYNWLKNDLETNIKPLIFIIGHEPFVSLPDFHNGRHRHKGDNLDEYPENSHRFQELLREHHIVAYICGHTHNFSYAKINGLWQIDAGHCRGIGDTGARSTFLKFRIENQSCRVEVYRDDASGGTYELTNTIELK